MRHILPHASLYSPKKELNMKLAVIGSREFKDMDLMREHIKLLQPSVIISGGAKGADTLAKQYAQENNLQMIEYKADWKKFGRAAGVIRNKTIIENAEHILAFWDGKTPGTKNSIDYANKLSKPITTITFNK